jgi:hypothetical protein
VSAGRAEVGQRHHIACPYLRFYGREAAWREDNRRWDNGALYEMAGVTALGHAKSRNWCWYWQRHAATPGFPIRSSSPPLCRRIDLSTRLSMAVSSSLSFGSKPRRSAMMSDICRIARGYVAVRSVSITSRGSSPSSNHPRALARILGRDQLGIVGRVEDADRGVNVDEIGPRLA